MIEGWVIEGWEMGVKKDYIYIRGELMSESEEIKDEIEEW